MSATRCVGSIQQAVLRSYTSWRGSCARCGWRGKLNANGDPRLHIPRPFPEDDPRYERSCWYCRLRRAVNKDHVIPKARRRSRSKRGKGFRNADVDGVPIPAHLLETVPACFECNTRKGTRLLVPPSWSGRLPELNALGFGTFRVWNGDPAARAFRHAHRN